MESRTPVNILMGVRMGNSRVAGRVSQIKKLGGCFAWSSGPFNRDRLANTRVS